MDDVLKEQIGSRGNYTMTPNDLISNPKLSPKSKVVWQYMASKPANWQFSAQRISKAIGIGRKAVLGAIAELKEYGWLDSQRCGDGRVNYVLQYPQSQKGTVDVQNATVPKSHGAKTGPLSNIDVEVKKNQNKSAFGAWRQREARVDYKTVDIVDVAEPEDWRAIAKKLYPNEKAIDKYSNWNDTPYWLKEEIIGAA
ncbi:helix-turn-helix domain-containing protein [Cerasicoccus fimbriatus]|uniref:helix-turn-helix domain-containing protein n=1 Tax=Cerasicoccus fimbriatus TaxID=3014554 RepID=UPI0022B51782|nr:helix-turn-helix domain-containing protein [Cerasicoccus sp. TK19100]